MDDSHLYERIAADIRRSIMDGDYIPGSQLPPVRELTIFWNCSIGTVQKAYRLLAAEGMITIRPGQGTHVTSVMDYASIRPFTPLRRAALVNRTETFLLEEITAGYTLDEIHQALNTAMDRWRVQPKKAQHQNKSVIHFTGSHDLALTRIASLIGQVIPDVSLKLKITGSLGGLIALAENDCDLAGCHLWDAPTGTYNDPFITRLFPGEKMLVMHLASRALGLIIVPGNPRGIHSLSDLPGGKTRYANRPTGSGTRLWFDEQLRKLHINADGINGYDLEFGNHTEVARAIADGRADVGLGLMVAAHQFGLEFIPLISERYDLVTYSEPELQPPLSLLLDWIASEDFHRKIKNLPGYDFSQTGQQRILDC